MAEDRYARIDARLLLDGLADLDGRASTFRYDDDAVALACIVHLFNLFAHRVDVELDLRDEDELSAARDAGHHGQPAGVASHDLDEHDAAMCRSRIAKLIDGIDDRVGRRVAADRVVHAPDIVVNRARQADNRQARLLREQRAARQAAVATDDDEAMLHQFVVSLLTAFRRLELRAASRSEERATALDEVADAAARELLDIVIEHALVAVVDAIDFYTLVKCRTDNGTCRSIHAWAVATRCHYSNRFFDHGNISPIPSIPYYPNHPDASCGRITKWLGHVLLSFFILRNSSKNVKGFMQNNAFSLQKRRCRLRILFQVEARGIRGKIGHSKTAMRSFFASVSTLLTSSSMPISLSFLKAAMSSSSTETELVI